MTGGLGFIGSHLAHSLTELEVEVVVIDNSPAEVGEYLAMGDHPNLRLVQGDILDPPVLDRAINGCDTVFHLAANSDVRRGSIDTRTDYELNILATYCLLEAMKRSDSCRAIVFASTSTVYGEPMVIPTPEDYGPLKPISLYGASKLACESLVSGYAHLFGFQASVLRLANVVGPRGRRGVVYDFISKLERSKESLEILGDGQQTKSYLYIDDCIGAFLTVFNNTNQEFEVYNIGSEDSISVLSIARIVMEELGLSGVEVRCDDVVGDGRGWPGDIKKMLLDISKIKGLGWNPRLNSDGAVRRAAKDIASELKLAKLAA